MARVPPCLGGSCEFESRRDRQGDWVKTMAWVHPPPASLRCPVTMKLMASVEKKIQFGGWDKKPWREIRNQVSKFWKDEDDNRHLKVPSSKRHPCKRNRGNHSFVILKETPPSSDSFWSRIYKGQTHYDLRCTACGKHSWAIGEKELHKKLHGKN